METEAAVMIEHKELVPDSGGAGMHRGGAAQEIKLRNTSSKPMYVSLITERTKKAPRGMFGGGDGMRPKFELEDGTPLNPRLSSIWIESSKCCHDELLSPVQTMAWRCTPAQPARVITNGR